MKKKSNMKAKIKVLLLLLAILLINIYAFDFSGNNIYNSSDSSKEDKIDNDDTINTPKVSILGDDPWWNISYDYRTLITITNPHEEDLLDYTVSIKVNHTKLDLDGKMQDDYDDIRIVENGLLRKYYTTKEGDIVTVWFETNVSANTEEYDTYLYYGNNSVGKSPGYYMDDRLPAYWWRFEEGSGSVTGDSGKTTGINNGTLNNMQSNDWVSGQTEDYCLDYDGTNDYVSVNSDPISSDLFSISLWFNSRSTTGTIYDQSWGDAGLGSDRIYFYIQLENGYIDWEFEDVNDGDFRLSYQVSNPTNTWHHVVATADWNSNYRSLWVDGQLRRSSTSNIAGKPSLEPPNIGTYTINYLGARTFFNGKIDDVRIYDYEIDSADMNWLYTNYKIDTTLNEEEPQSASFVVTAVDLYDKYIPYANISIYDGPSDGTSLQSKIADSVGTATFTGLTFDTYNFSVSISSNLIEGYEEVVNRTINGFSLAEISKEIDLICNVSTNGFTVLDIDGAPVESGWIIVGQPNSPGFEEIQKILIDPSGLASFYWVNTTPYEYNYTIYYQNDDYMPNIITLDSGLIDQVDTDYIKYTHLTTVNFTLISTEIGNPVIPGATLNLTKYGTFESIVNLTSDQNGIATLRWLNSSGINADYNLKINFFGAVPFNITTGGPSNELAFRFTVSSNTSYELICSTDPDDYATEIVILNPSLSIEARWGTEVKLRALLNISKADPTPSLIGPVYADSMTYKVLFENNEIISGTMDIEGNYEGRHQGLIDTSQLESGKTYFVKILAEKTGFKPPNDEQLILSIVKNNLILNQSENDNSKTDVYWLEIANMTVKPYGEISEILTIEDDIFIGDKDNVQVSIPDLYTEWSLSKIEFNIYNVQHGSKASMKLEITDPDDITHIWDQSNVSNYEHYGDTATNGTWIDLIIDPDNDFQEVDNNFNFAIDGTFTGTVKVVVEATFIRDNIEVEYFESNVTDSIVIPSDRNGWAIKNIIFEIMNFQNLAGTPLNPASYIDNITTNEGYTVDYFYDTDNGYGKININDTIIYPLNDEFLFTIANTSNIIFDAMIKVEYIQEFYENLYSEVISYSKTENNFADLDTFSISPVSDWTDQGVTLYITDLKNSTSNLVYPSEVAMNITIDGVTYYFQDGAVIGTGFLLLRNIPKDSILTASIQANDTIKLNLKFTVNYLRSVYYETSATITYEIRGEDIIGTVVYDSEFEYYQASIDTSLVDADDYTIRFSAVKTDYNIGQEDFELDVMERLTLISGAAGFYQQFLNLYIKDASNYTYTYTDTIFGTKISDLEQQTFKWEYFGDGSTILQSGSGELINVGGDYVLDFDTETRPVGRYSIILTLDKENYEVKFALISLTVNLREIDYDLGDMFEDKQVSVVKGETVTLEIELTDPTQGDILITGAKVVLEIGDDEFEFDEVEDGIYELEFDAKDYEAFFTSNTLTGTIKISREDYDSKEVDITIVVEMEEVVEDVPTFYFLIVVSAIVAIIGSLATYRVIQVVRIPTFVKKAKKLRKAIKSGSEVSEDLLYPPKEDFLVKTLEAKYKVLGISLDDLLGLKGKEKTGDSLKDNGGVK